MPDRTDVTELEPPDHLFHWLEATTRRLREEVYSHTGREALPVRGSQGRVLQLIPTTGIRITDLAERAELTKQAVGQLVNLLEDRGLVTSEADPADLRVRLVRQTKAGAAANEQIQSVISSAETSLRSSLGSDRFDVMKDALRSLGARGETATS